MIRTSASAVEAPCSESPCFAFLDDKLWFWTGTQWSWAAGATTDPQPTPRALFGFGTFAPRDSHTDATATCAGKADGYWCGGTLDGDPNTLYTCSQGQAAPLERCVCNARTNPGASRGNDACQ